MQDREDFNVQLTAMNDELNLMLYMACTAAPKREQWAKRKKQKEMTTQSVCLKT
jgi:hypothetical protein